MGIFLFVVLTSSIVSAFSLSDLGGSKKRKKQEGFATVDVGSLRRQMKIYKEAEVRLRQLDGEYSEYSKVILAEQNSRTNELMAKYEQAGMGKSDSENRILLEVYKEKAASLAQEAQNKLDAKQEELNIKRQEIEKDSRAKVWQVIRIVAREEGIRYVIDKESGLFVERDVTSQIIAAEKKQEDKKKRWF